MFHSISINLRMSSQPVEGFKQAIYSGIGKNAKIAAVALAVLSAAAFIYMAVKAYYVKRIGTSKEPDLKEHISPILQKQPSDPKIPLAFPLTPEHNPSISKNPHAPSPDASIISLPSPPRPIEQADLDPVAKASIEKLRKQLGQTDGYRPIDEVPELKNLNNFGSEIIDVDTGKVIPPVISLMWERQMDEASKMLTDAPTGFLRLGLENVFAWNRSEAEGLAKELGGMVCQGQTGLYIRIRVERAFEIAQQPPIAAILNTVTEVIESKHKFQGYKLPGLSQNDAASFNAVPAIRDAKMELRTQVRVPGIGKVSNCYIWKEAPDTGAVVPDAIKNPAVILPPHIDASLFEKLRREVQTGVVSNLGIEADRAKEIALAIGGIIIEANLPFKAGVLLKDQGGDVDLHCIFQTGVNFAGVTGGGIPIPSEYLDDGELAINEYSVKNAKAALSAAVKNRSQVLVYNIGIGTGFFGGRYGSAVKNANVDGICQAVNEIVSDDAPIEVVVPNIGFNDQQKKKLSDAGIRIVAGDKDAFAALSVRRGLRVSVNFAADPMTMLGIHGPGLWWETVGSASDEERAAFLSPCYALGHIPIDVFESDKPAGKIAALSEFMVL